MKEIWFLHNGSFASKSIDFVFDSLCASFKDMGFLLKRKATDTLCVWLDNCGNVQCDEEKPLAAIFWDKDFLVAQLLEKWGVRVFNNSKVTELCDSKDKLSVFLSGSGTKMPKTFVAPLVYSNQERQGREFLENAVKELGFPMVIKQAQGSLGQQVSLVKNFQQMQDLHGKLQHTPHVFQQYVAESFGHDLRVFVVGGKAVAAMERRNTNDFRANIELGGEGHAVTLTQEQKCFAENVSSLLGADFVGIDILWGKDQLFFCEANSCAFFKEISAKANIDIGRLIAQHVVSSI